MRFAFLGFLIWLGATSGVAAEDIFPGTTWTRRTPAQVGLRETSLDQFRDHVGGRGCVVRHGFLVYVWGDVVRRADIASACKPWFTHFLMRAHEQGKIKSLDDAILAHEPRLNDLNVALGRKDRQITWRQLAYQTSCYGVRETPGTAYDYSDFNMALFADTLFGKVYGCAWERIDAEVLHPLLTDILQCEDQPTLRALKSPERMGRVGVSVRDHARFGLLYLRGGRWRDQQLLRADLAQLAVSNPLPARLPRTKAEKAEMIPKQRSLGGGNNQTDHFGSYSFAWWTNGIDRDGRRHWPDAPADTFAALGHAGKRALVVIPSLDLVVTWNDSSIDGRERENEALRNLMLAAASR